MIDIERKGMLNHTHSEISISSTCSQTFHYLPKRVSFRDDYLTSIPTESRNAETRAQRNCAEPVTRSLSMLMIEFEAEKELRKQTDPRDSGTSLDFIPVNVKDEMIIKPKAEGDLRKIKKCLDLLKTTLT